MASGLSGITLTPPTSGRWSRTACPRTSGVGNSAPVMTYEHSQAIASALLLANLNSLPLDWAARLSVGGVNMNFFIVKQLPVLPPETHLEEACQGITYVELVVPRVLELTYTAYDLQGFAQDLGYDGPPFPWAEERRHQPQVRARRYLRPHVPTRPLRSGVDTGRAGSVFIVPWVETQRDAGIRRVPHAAVRPPSL